MSCFQCTPEHIAAIVELARATGASPHVSATQDACPVPVRHGRIDWCSERADGSVFALLWAANARSVSERYGEQANDLTPNRPRVARVDLRSPSWGVARVVEYAKALDCYDYQCSDAAAWAPGDIAHDLIGVLREMLLRSLPGYRGANWGSPGPQAAA